jgi:phosphate transport system substrate-binding protein
MKISRPLKIAVAAVAVALSASSTAFADVAISGNGSSFAAPLINACKVGWQNANTANGYTLASYGGAGSGTGRSNSDKGIGDFNFSDAVHTTPVQPIVQIPVVAAPIAIVYNLGGRDGLVLTQETLAKIFAGKITKWNDPEIVKENNTTTTKVIFKEDADGNPVKDAAGKPIVLRTTTVKNRFSLPNKTINVVVRAGGSGTTQNLVNFFIKQFPTMWTKPTSDTFANVFPGDINGAGNLGRFIAVSGSALLSSTVKSTAYSISYVESSYGTKKQLGIAAIQNAAGNYQMPDAAGTAAFLGAATAASNGALTFNYDTKEPGAYVLGIVTYALVDTSRSGDAAVATKSFLKYLLSPACPTTDSTLEYTTITGNLLKVDNDLIAKL